MALLDELRKLVKLQKIDHQVDQHHKAIARLEQDEEIARLKKRQQNLEKQRVELAAERQDLHQVLKQKELELASLENEKEQQSSKLYSGSVSSSRELEGLQQKVSELEERVSSAELEVLEAMEDLELVASDYDELVNQLEQVSDQLAAREDEVAEEIDQHRQEIASLEPSVEAARQQVDDAQLLRRYDQARERSGGVVVSTVEQEGYCSGCHVKLPVILKQQVQAAEKIVSCSQCGRMLVWMGE